MRRLILSGLALFATSARAPVGPWRPRACFTTRSGKCGTTRRR